MNKNIIFLPAAFIFLSIIFFGCFGTGTKSEVGVNGAGVNGAGVSGVGTSGTEASGPVNNTTVAPQQSSPAQHITINLTLGRSPSKVMNTDTVFPKALEYDFSNRTTADGRLIVYFFYSPYCSASKAIRPEIDKLEQRYQNVSWNEYDITTANGSVAYSNFASQKNLGAKERFVPQVLVDGRVITDRFNINNTLEDVIQNFSKSAS